MRTTNNLAKIRRTGLNSFGQPYTGNAIRGVQNRRMMGGRPQGPLSTRPAQATGEVARMQREEAEDMAAMDAARRAGMAKAQAEAQAKAPAPQTQNFGTSSTLVAPKPPLATARRSRSARFGREGLTYSEMMQRKKQGGTVFTP